MKQTLRNTFLVAALAGTVGANAQRYLSEVFTDAQLVITPNVTFGTNIDFLTSDFSNPVIYGPNIVELQTAVSTQQPIPPAYFNPADPSTFDGTSMRGSD